MTQRLRDVAVGLMACVLWLFVCAYLSGCASLTKGKVNPEDVPAGSKLISGVPFYPQEDYQCGPACLAGVLNFLGERTTPAEVAGKVFRENLRSTTTLDMALYPRGLGYETRWYDGGMRDLIKAVDQGQPRIIFVDYGLGPVSTYHFMVVVGYSPTGAIVNSGVDAHKEIDWASFMGPWERTKCWTLQILPKT